jgi:hypothetical protein
LPAADLAAVKALSKVYGAASPGGFIAEMVGSICSGDPKRISGFNTKLLMKVGEQLAFDYTQKATLQAEKHARKVKRRPSR